MGDGAAYRTGLAFCEPRGQNSSLVVQESLIHLPVGIVCPPALPVGCPVTLSGCLKLTPLLPVPRQLLCQKPDTRTVFTQPLPCRQGRLILFSCLAKGFQGLLIAVISFLPLLFLQGRPLQPVSKALCLFPACLQILLKRVKTVIGFQVFFHPGNIANQAVSVSLAFLLPLIPGPCLLQNRRILPEHIRGSGHIPADRGIPLHFPQLHSKGSHLIPDQGHGSVLPLLLRLICRNQLVQHLQKSFQASLGHLLPAKLQFLTMALCDNTSCILFHTLPAVRVTAIQALGPVLQLFLKQLIGLCLEYFPENDAPILGSA